MNPEPQAGGSAGNQDEPGHGANAAPAQTEVVQADAAAPLAPAEPQNASSHAAAAPAPAADPEEQHFFRADTAPLPSSGLAPAPPSPAAPHEADLRMQSDGREVSWRALEFIAHEKPAGWYLAFGGVSVVLVALVWLVTRSMFSPVAAALACGIFAYAAARQPREMNYAVDDHGISTGRTFHAYSDFRGFSIVQEGEMLSLSFIPLKRFMPLMSVYFDPADQERITAVLADHLPLEDHRSDLVERLMHRIRF